MWQTEDNLQESAHASQQGPLPLDHLANPRKSLLCEWIGVNTHLRPHTCMASFRVHAIVRISLLPAFCANHRQESSGRAPAARLVTEQPKTSCTLCLSLTQKGLLLLTSHGRTDCRVLQPSFLGREPACL